MKPLWQLLISRKFAVWQLLILILILLAGIIFPDAQITTSRLFLVPAALVFISILACSIQRIIRRDEWETEPAKVFSVGEECFSGSSQKSSEVVKEEVAGLLRERGWRVDATRSEGLLAFQGEPGFWGSMVFHAAMLVILIGVTLTVLSRTVTGFSITEGETKDLMAPGVVQAEESLLGPVRVPMRLTLQKFSADYVEGTHPVDYEAVLWVEESGRQPREVVTRVNRPFSSGKADIYMDKYGFAPRFVLTKDDGTELSDYHYNLSVLDGKEDSLELPEIGATVTVVFFPSFKLEEGNTVTNVSQEPTNPGMVISIAREGQVVVNRVFVPLGKRVRFEGMSLQFAGWRFWTHFGISRDLGVNWILVGFLTLVVGLVLRFAYPDRRLWVRIGEEGAGCTVAMGGHGGHFAALFREELTMLGERVKGVL
ncbi:MAG: cytochrome c biogenesis protein ResB [Nitrospirota bacterium]|nr:cytochrome c biogenesis protein ResB [Nitrospirota bacterium]